MLKFDNPIAQAKIAGLRLAHVEIHLAGDRPILRAHFQHIDPNGKPLTQAPLQFLVVNDANGNHFDALFSADGGADSLRTRLYKALAATLPGTKTTTIVADAIAVPAPAPAQVKAAAAADVAAAEATPIVAAKGDTTA